jgi:hypothetical protein
MRRALAIIVGAALLGILAGLTRVPWTAERTPRSLLRLSWRALGERIERCRPATEDDLRGVPAHMRQDVICEEPRVAPYKLRVAVDGRVLEDGLAEGSGISGDRPMYVLHEFDIAPGAHAVEVRFERQGQALAAGGDDKSETEREHDREIRRRAIPPALILDTTVTFEANTVLLVTFSPELRRLVLMSPVR